MYENTSASTLYCQRALGAAVEAVPKGIAQNTVVEKNGLFDATIRSHLVTVEKARALLAYLALNPDQLIPEEWLAPGFDIV